MKPIACLLGPVALVLVPAAAPLLAQQPGPATAAAAPQADPAVVVGAARKLLAERYVLPETAARLDAALAEAEERGEFRGLAGAALAERIIEVVRTVTADGHLYASYNPAQAAAIAAAGPPEDEDSVLPADYVRQIERDNGGVHRLEVLPGNVRYIDYRQFMWGTPAAEASLAAAMEFLRGGDALIIDLRNNGGGSPGAVAAMTSYFLPAGTKLARFEMRGLPGEASETVATPFSLAGKPLYVLTSRRSFSAAEEFAMHVSAFGFGQLVGTATGGGGHRNELFALPGGYVISISTGRPVHALTGGGWEGTGVAPAIAVAEDKALLRAQAEAMTAIAAATAGPERAAAERLAAYYRALESPAAPAMPLEAYAGVYGDRTVTVVDGQLLMRRGTRPAARLVPLGSDLFASEAAPTLRVGFVTENGAVAGLELDNGDGAPNRIARQSRPS
jgi:hypothetical protein